MDLIQRLTRLCSLLDFTSSQFLHTAAAWSIECQSA